MMKTPQEALRKIEARIVKKSHASRTQYLAQLEQDKQTARIRQLSCGNIAHGFAACDKHKKSSLMAGARKNIAIVSAYNEILSAHSPYQDYPQQIQHIIQTGPMRDYASAQFAAGVPAMCDGVTQGQTGMELSLFSRDVIAQATAIALSHQLFDGVFCLGICDKIVPGLLIGALHFGHLPAVFLPSGPMPTGLPNTEKVRIRKAYAAGKATRSDLLDAEVNSYHSPGTCTFYGTANTNQLLMEAMGLHLPGASFEGPDTALRKQLTQAAVNQMQTLIETDKCLGKLVCEQSIINAMVALSASGGSTNHTIHLVAIARCAGVHIDWQDFHDISSITPLLTRIYPNGSADVNDFHYAGGIPCLLTQLNKLGLLLPTPTLLDDDLSTHFKQPVIKSSTLTYQTTNNESDDPAIIAAADHPFHPTGGIVLLKGNLGRAIAKSSAVDPDHWIIEAPARVFSYLNDLKQALDAGQIQSDSVIVLKYQGPKACGMPELHGFIPQLSNLLDQGIRVALVTDGRMSGASGRVPAAIHLTPETLDNQMLAKVRDADRLRVDFKQGELTVLNLNNDEFAGRLVSHPDLSEFETTMGRALFKANRQSVGSAEQGAMTFG